MDKINEAKASYYLLLLIALLWSILTINHLSRGLNWMPLLWMYPPISVVLFFVRKSVK